nr:hypothetical protein [Tanacetum cinerariifolium]
NPRVQKVRNYNGLIVVLGIANQNPNGNGNVVAAQVKDNANRNSVADCLKEEAGIQLQAKEFDLMDAVVDLDKIEEVNANCILMANLQQASTSGTQPDKAPVYDSDGSAKTEMELELEQTQQGSSHEVSVSTEGVEELKRIVRIKGVKKEALHTTLGRNQ